MGAAADAYNAMVRAYDDQRTLRSGRVEGSDRWSNAAARFRDDPRRELDASLRTVAEYVGPEDVLVDVGGGAGRFSLPIALRCKEVINVEPATGMGETFEASAREAGITNARWIGADWLSAPEVEGDVLLTAHVTYFVNDIVPFLEKLDRCARRRVLIVMSSTPPPNQGADTYAVVYDEPQALVPDYRALLPVLWEMGKLPDLRVLTSVGAGSLQLAASLRTLASREEAIASLAQDRVLNSSDAERARARIEASFDRLFETTGSGYRRREAEAARLLIVTWETERAG